MAEPLSSLNLFNGLPYEQYSKSGDQKAYNSITVNIKSSLILLYLVMITGFVVAMINYLPKVFMQILQLKEILVRLTNLPAPQDEISRYMYKT